MAMHRPPHEKVSASLPKVWRALAGRVTAAPGLAAGLAGRGGLPGGARAEKGGLGSALTLVNHTFYQGLSYCSFGFKKELFSSRSLELLESFDCCTVGMSDFHDSQCAWICVC